jgi:predicted acetyltransferase
MPSLIIRELEAGDESAFRQATSRPIAPDFDWVASWFSIGMPFKEVLNRLQGERSGRDLAPGRVPSTILFGFEDGAIVGRVSIRHQLNDYLATVGGHIGYGVLLDFRGRGFATQLLRAGLRRAGELGIDRALLTCDATNDASRRVIEKCGGQLESQISSQGIVKFRYWINLTAP